jgi:DNA-binding IscR family transcriptional regulator
MQKADIEKEQIQQIAAFLSKYGFVEAREKNGSVKLSRTAQEFLTRTTTA